MRQILKNFDFKLGWLWLCLFIIISSLFYYIHQTDIYSLVLSLILSYIPIKWILNERSKNKTNDEKQENKTKIKNKLIFTLFLIFYLISTAILIISQSDQALISPWQVVPTYFFVFLILTIFLALLYLKNYRNSIYQKVCLFLIYLLSFSVALIVYKVGYGYDPFVHQANINHIIENGFILPKNLFYIGQYNLIIAFNQFFALPIEISNKIIVPLFAAIFVPLLSLEFLKKNIKLPEVKANLYLTVALSLMLGFSIFIVSTPQNLAYIFLLATIVFNLNKQVLPYGLASSLATFFIHPIAGIPALLFTGIYIAKIIIKKKKYQKIIANLIYLLTIFLIPFSLVIGAKANFNWQINFNFPSFFYLNQENIFLNFIYFFINNYFWFLLLFIITTLIYLIKSPYFNKIIPSIKMSVALLIATFFSFFLNWQELINYEQSDYANRFLIISLLFLLPLVWLFLLKIIEKLKNLSKTKQIVFLLFFSLLITFSLYGSYPREDNYHNSRGYSLSKNDLKVVDIIDNWTDEDYIVLANQQIGVAALKEKGYDNYLTSDYGPIYFYSIPTGGKLYSHYLEMVYDEASKENMRKAMDLVEVDHGFLVINKYWWASERIIKEAQLSANDYRQINGGGIIIFKYLNN